ncbi:FecR family protein [Flavobacterium caeni]|uniref:FecR family protein n=1 Tax=Flavobacterium caeni TaxID=490189 RepID=A0A1G5E3B1_9FLAO|nr:FecR domain-containing protein [Flavobacterium caeni]SCY21422.1 FecR family protein [Flavobacterium caeni]
MDNDTQLARWLAGELDADELDALQKDPKYDNYVRIRENLDRIASPQFDANKMLHEVLAHEKASPKTIPLYRRRWVQVAAAVVVLLGVAAAWFAPTTQTAAAGQTLAFVLPDQSQVQLNAGSTASYATWNWENDRGVLLDGEAYFKVAKGKKFTVLTERGAVSVLGTQFNVRQRGNRMEVACYEGRVLVTFHESEAILARGEQIAIDGSRIWRSKTDAAGPAWLQDELVFNQHSLADVVAEIQRHYGVKINLGHQSTQLFSGVLPGDNIDAALQIVCATFHLKQTKTEKAITLTAADDRP